MSCEYCHLKPGDEGNNFRNKDNKSAGTYIFRLKDGGYYLGNVYGLVDPEINFCPNCGEPLTEPRALTLEELRRKRWVWIKFLKKSLGVGGWARVLVNSHTVCYLGGFHYFGSYGKEWLAYDSEPRKKGVK